MTSSCFVFCLLCCVFWWGGENKNNFGLTISEPEVVRTPTDLPHTSGPQKEFSVERFPPLKLCSSGGQRGLSAVGQVWVLESACL